MARKPQRKRFLVMLLSITFWLSAASNFWLSPTAAQSGIPTQFIAKMYTEALGRTPDASGYQAAVNFFTQNGCNASRLKTWGRGVYLSAEYNNLGYDNAAKVLTLYRGILNREPDQAGFDHFYNQLNSGVSLATVVDAMFNSGEFQGLVPQICGGGTTPDRFSYGFGSNYALKIPTTGSGVKVDTNRQLQPIIDSTPAGGTVWLAQKAVVRLLEPLHIKEGVTLSTTGGPSHNHYALMARLVRDTHFSSTTCPPENKGCPAVILHSGAKLKAVWVDGQRGVVGFDQNHINDINVALLPGAGSQVSDCLLSNTAGWTNLQVYGSGELPHKPCSNISIVHNLVTAYSSSHYSPDPATITPWADGLSCACESTLIQENEVVDATDVGIIIYRSTPATQKSLVRNNRVFSAGNSAYAAYAADPLKVMTSEPTVDRYFSGSMVQNNLLWTGPNSHFDIALAVGSRAWFGDSSLNPDPSALGHGATFSGNTTGSLSARVGSGIGVCGMKEATVQSNVLTVSLIPYDCPRYNVWACSGYSSGSIQAYTQVSLPKHCIGHPGTGQK
ncbi:MAG TPA: DUF4214 domain-containing protein [Blastocatellia bacterium]|nr:DUF4214 domain-containing protein [Blastocatellia bacterium]